MQEAAERSSRVAPVIAAEQKLLELWFLHMLEQQSRYGPTLSRTGNSADGAPPEYWREMERLW